MRKRGEEKTYDCTGRCPNGETACQEGHGSNSGVGQSIPRVAVQAKRATAVKLSVDLRTMRDSLYESELEQRDGKDCPDHGDGRLQ